MGHDMHSDLEANRRISDFVEKLFSPGDIIVPEKDGEDRYFVIHRLMYHWTVQVYHYPMWEFYDNRWCFATKEMAVNAVAEWATRAFEGEPEGWHRHPPTGRRRTDGDPSTEYIEY